MSTRSHAVRIAAPVDREWRRLVTMIVAVLLALGAVVAIASLGGGPDTRSKGGTKGTTGTAPVSRVGGNGDFQYKVLP